MKGDFDGQTGKRTEKASKTEGKSAREAIQKDQQRAGYLPDPILFSDMYGFCTSSNMEEGCRVTCKLTGRMLDKSIKKEENAGNPAKRWNE